MVDGHGEARGHRLDGGGMHLPSVGGGGAILQRDSGGLDCPLCLVDIPQQSGEEEAAAGTSDNRNFAFFKEFWNTPLRWEAAALGLASILLSLGKPTCFYP